MHDAVVLIPFWSAFLLALVVPGPNFAVVAGTAVREGRRRAFGTAVGLAGGEAVWGAAAVFGVSALAAQHPLFAITLRIGGGLFLLYLGLSAIRSAARPNPASQLTRPDASPPRSNGSGIWRGFGLMLLNPKAGVFWLSLSSVFLGTSVSGSTAAIAVVGAVFLSLSWHGALAWMLSTARVAHVLARTRRALDAVLGTVLTALGVKLLASG